MTGLFTERTQVYVDSLHGRLEQSGGGCHIGGHFVGVLAYADVGSA